MDTIKAHFESEAQEFDETIIKLIPYYNQMIDALLDSIHFDENAAIRILDLGCGTGTISKRISEKFPNSKISCLDVASNMIEIAKYKLSAHADVEFINGDFSKIDTSVKYDVIVSSLALHHIQTDTEKKDFYTQIYHCLADSGVFYNADVVLASSDYVQEVNMNRWIEFMNKRVPMDEVLNKWIATYKSEDKPAKLLQQLQWLEDIGFTSIDVIWKYYNFSVYGGIK